MSSSFAKSVPERFSADMVELRHVLFKRCISFGQPVAAVMLAMLYLRRAEERLKRLFERFYAGKLGGKPRKPPLRPKQAPVPPAEGEETPEKPKRMSRAFGWFCKLINPDGYVYADRLCDMLNDPETAKLLEAAPQAARLFRPLCQMFGIRSDTLPPTQRKRRPRPVDAATAARRAERDEMRAFRALGKTSSKKSVVPPGHTFPTNERDWAIYWGRVHRAEQRRKGKKSKPA